MNRSMKKKAEPIPVLVTTEHRGVFFGYLAPGQGVQDGRITIQKARCCVYWSSDIKGFLGLASTGPSKSCRVGPAVMSLELCKVTAVAKCSPEATEAWEKSPWS